MQGRTGLAAAIACTVLWSAGALAQAPAAAPSDQQVDQALQELRKPGPADAATRERAALALVTAAAGNGLSADGRRRAEAGAAAVLLGADATAREALLAALSGKPHHAVVRAWRAPLSMLALDPERPAGVLPVAVRRLCEAADRGLLLEIVERCEDVARPAPERLRAVEAAGWFGRYELRRWGPVPSLVKLLDDATVGAAALRVLRQVLILNGDFDKDRVRRWWTQHRDRDAAVVMAERLAKANERERSKRERERQQWLALLDDAGAPLVRLGLEQSDPLVRAAAAVRAAKLPSAAARPLFGVLVKRLQAESVADARLAYVGSMAGLITAKDEAAIELLTGRQKTEPDPRVRAAGARALGATQAERAGTALLDALHTDTDPTVRQAAAEALGPWRGRVAVEAIVKALSPPGANGAGGGEASPAVRAAVARTLGSWGETAEGDPAACGPLARAASADPDPGVRWQAVYALGLVRCADTTAVEALAHAVREAEVPRVRLRAASDLGKRAGAAEREPAAKALTAILRDRDAEVGAAARAGLLELGGTDAAALVALGEQAGSAGAILAEALCYDAALAVRGNGAGGKALDAATADRIRRRVVDRFRRSVSDGAKPAEAAANAAKHALVLYEAEPTVNLARDIAKDLRDAGRYDAAMKHLKGAAVRFGDQSAALLALGLGYLEQWADGGAEVRAEAALAALGDLPEALQPRAVRLKAGRLAAAALAKAAQNDAGARTDLHARIGRAAGDELHGMVAACLRRLAAAGGLAAEADQALRASPLTAPAGLAELTAESTPADRRRAHDRWSTAWGTHQRGGTGG